MPIITQRTRTRQARPTPEPAIFVTPQPPVTVKLCANPSAEYRWAIESTPPGAAPKLVDTVLPHLPTEYQRYVRDYAGYDLLWCIRNRPAIPTAIWQDAIARAISVELARAASADKYAPTVLTPLAVDAYLALGDGIYRLQPIAHAPATKALSIVRKRALNLAHAERDRIISDARLSCQGIHTEANARMADARRMIEEARHSNAPPAWTAGRTLYLDGNGTWRIAIEFNHAVTTFMWKQPHGDRTFIIKEWNALPVPAFRVRMFAPLQPEGLCPAPTTIKLDSMCHFLPHLSHETTCMSPASMPPTLSSGVDCARLAGAIQQCLKVVDLSSLLNHYPDWDIRIKRATPPALKAILRNRQNWVQGLIDVASGDRPNRTINLDTDAAATFTAPANAAPIIPDIDGIEVAGMLGEPEPDEPETDEEENQ